MKEREKMKKRNDNGKRNTHEKEPKLDFRNNSSLYDYDPEEETSDSGWQNIDGEEEESQPTSAGTQPIYGQINPQENLSTSVISEERQGNLPKRLRRLTPSQRKVHICFFVSLISCFIFVLLVICVSILEEDL